MENDVMCMSQASQGLLMLKVAFLMHTNTVFQDVLIPSAAENLCDIVHANAKEMLSTRQQVEQIVQNSSTSRPQPVPQMHGNGSHH